MTTTQDIKKLTDNQLRGEIENASNMISELIKELSSRQENR